MAARRIGILFFAMLALLHAGTVAAQFPVVPMPSGRYRPDYVWKTVRAGRFVIYYVEGHEAHAQRIVQLAEEVGRDVTSYLDVDPRDCPVVLSPDDSYFNGNFAPFPARVTLFETPITDEESLAYFGPAHGDLTDILFTHEYVHYAHITTNAGPAGFVSRLLGPGFTIANALARPWQTEGLATYLETKFTDGGRLRSALFRAILLAHARDGTMWNYSTAGSLERRSWPGGSRVYLGGSYFSQYLDRRFGEGTMAKAAKHQASWLLPLTQGGLANATGQSTDALYSDFLAYLVAEARRDADAAKALALPEGSPLLAGRPEQDSYAQPIWTADGRILALRSSLDRVQALVELNRDGQLLDETPIPYYVAGRIALIDEGAVLFGVPYQHPIGDVKDAPVDLTRIALRDGSTQRLTDAAWMYEGAVSPNGERLVAQRRRGAWLDLVLLDAHHPATGDPKALAGQPGMSYFGPAWSPDGTEILATAKVGAMTDLVRIDLATGTVETLFAADAAADLGGRYACKGRFVVFASDRSGLWNIYAFDRSARELRQLTSVASAAFEPDVSPDCETLAFTTYTGRGNEIRTLPFRPAAGRRIATQKGGPLPSPDLARVTPQAPLPPASSPPVSDYLPFAHWPAFTADEEGVAYGVILGGADPLYHNFYRVAPFYGVESRRPGYDARFENRSTWANLTFRAYDGSLFGNTLEGGAKRWLRERGGVLAAALPMLPRAVPTHVELTPSIGTSVRRFSGLREVVIDPEQDTSIGALIGLRVANKRSMARRSAFVDGGEELRIGYERSARDFGSELPGSNFSLALTARENVEPHNVGWRLRLAHQRQSGAIHHEARQVVPRGYVDADPDDGFDRARVASASAELHLPLAYPAAGLTNVTLHASMLTLGAFADQGFGWNEGESAGQAWRERRRASGGLTFNLFGHVLAEFLGEMRLTATAGLRQGGEPFFGFSFGGPLLDAEDSELHER